MRRNTAGGKGISLSSNCRPSVPAALPYSTNRHFPVASLCIMSNNKFIVGMGTAVLREVAGQRDPCTDVLRRSRLMMRRGGLGSVAQRLPVAAADMTPTLGVVVLPNLHLLVAVSPNVSVRRGELVGTVAQTCPQRRPRRADLPAACGPHNVDLRWRTDSNVYHPFPRGRPPHTALTSGVVPAQRRSASA